MKGLTFGLLLGTATMTVFMSFLNHYFFIVPAYTFFLNMPAISNSELKSLIVTGILPFNVIKGVVLTFVFLWLYSKLKNWLKLQTA
jgi:riboflavin transporter